MCPSAKDANVISARGKKSVLPVLSPYPESEDALNTSITESAALKHEDVSGSAFRRVRIMFSQSYRSGCTVRVKVKVLKSTALVITAF